MSNDRSWYGGRLSHEYIAVGDYQKALVLTELIQADTAAELKAAEVLALVCLGNYDEAESALVCARTTHPKLFHALVVEDDQYPEFINSYQDVDDNEEWFDYRDKWLWLWQQLGALEWLKPRSIKPH